MATPKSPFMVFQEFLSPKICESIIGDLGFYTPDLNPEGDPLMMMRAHDKSEHSIYSRFQTLIPSIENHYGFKHRGTESIMFEYYSEGVAPVPHCENGEWIKKKWVRTRDRDFTCILFFNTFQDQIPYDNDYEVYGGKVEFPQHGFGFNPERGTMIVYPSGPHFINATNDIIEGELIMARFHLAASMPYLYDPSKFPGDFRSWFAGYF